MTYEEIVAYTKSKMDELDLSSNKGHLAVQINIQGEGEGAFYIELNDDAASVEPYEYFDRDAALAANAEVFKEIIDGKKDAVGAYLSGALKVDGNLDKAAEFGNLLKNAKKKAKKAAKAAAKTAKTAAKKTAKATKDALKTTAKTEKKASAEEKKAAVATAKKVVAKNASAKSAETK